MRVVALVVCALALVAGGVSARAGARRAGASIWYDAATRAEFCGITKPSLDTAAFGEFESAWAKAFGAKDTKACSGQTARAVFDKIKAGQVKAASPAKDYSDFAKLANECARELSTATGVVDPNGYGLWSGGFHCSEVAHAMFGVTVLERTQLGNILTQVFAYPTGVKKDELAPAWHDCCGNMWNALSTKYVDQMTGKCTVFFRYGGEDSVLYTQELPALQKLLDAGKISQVVFEVVMPDGSPQCGVRPGLRTTVPHVGVGEHNLQKVLKEVTKRANEQQPGSVPVVSLRAPPRAQTLLSGMRRRIAQHKGKAQARKFGAKRQV